MVTSVTPDAVSRYTDSVRHHQHQAHVDAGVPQPLPGQPPIREPALHPAVKALHHSPEPLVDPLLPLRTLHVDAILHREHIRRVLPALQPPLGDDVIYLQRLEELEQALGLELAVSGEELHLYALAQHPGQQRFDQLFLIHVERGLDVAQGEAFDVDEEEAQIAEEKAFLAPAEPGVGVSQAPAGVVGVSAAPRGEVCAAEPFSWLWDSLYFWGRDESTIPMGKKRKLTVGYKKKIMRRESELHGNTKKGSYAAEVQRQVDKSRSK